LTFFLAPLGGLQFGKLSELNGWFVYILWLFKYIDDVDYYSVAFIRVSFNLLSGVNVRTHVCR
jgi:hypothetical protein